MELNKAKSIMKKETTKERENAFFTLYGVDSQKDILEQFRAKVTALKVVPFSSTRMSKAKLTEKIEAQYTEQYTQLLELILEYSHAIFFLYSKERINKNFSSYRKVAIESIREDNVKKAFGQFKRLYNYKEETEETGQTEQKESQEAVNNDCLALQHIETLKSDLNGELSVMGGSVDDKKAYMKFAIISLATGANATDITDPKHTIDTGKAIYDHLYIDTLIKEIRAYQETRKKPLSARGIRNGVDKLKLPLSTKLKEKIGEKATHCRNFNHLLSLHNECQTSSTQK